MFIITTIYFAPTIMNISTINKKNNKINVLGAGISGLTAAINLAKHGYNVTVYEKTKDCGSRFGGDIQGLENWTYNTDVLKELEEINIKRNFEYVPFSEITITDSMEEIQLKSTDPIFYAVKRGIAKNTLDQALKQQAIESGVKLEFNSKIDYNNIDIVATGPAANIKVVAVDKGFVFETEHKNVTVVLLNNKIASNGYSYLTVANRHGCIGVVEYKNFNLIDLALAKATKIFKQKYSIELQNVRLFGGVGTFLFNPKLVVNTKLYVGEAAGIQDFLWMFGMRSSFISGYLAAKSIIEKSRYTVLIKNRLAQYKKAAIVNRFMWERSARNNFKKIFAIARKIEDIQTYFHKIYSFSILHRLLYPFAILTLKKEYL